MILEIAILNLKSGQCESFEAAFAQAVPIVQAAKGYISHELQCCIGTPDRYVLLIKWQTLEDHVTGFRGSAAYQEWRARLHHYYESFLVEHYRTI
ncbi:MAG: antibiotic biosynthesis monooxygenase family protein [Aggregatilineales bacterium]